jgi:hypothetical protein
MFFRLFILCSAHVSAIVIVMSVSPYEGIGKLETCPKEDIVGARLVVKSVTKTATSLGVSRATASKVMPACVNHVKTSAKRNSGRISTLTERDRRTCRRIV